MRRTLVVANQKGGVGKTTTAINLSAALALAGQRVLLVDLDPQANLTSGVGLKGQTGPGGSVYQALTGRPRRRALHPRRPRSWPALIPADRNLTGAEVELVRSPNREQRLRSFLGTPSRWFDYVFMDYPAVARPAHPERVRRRRLRVDSAELRILRARRARGLVATLRRVRAALNPALDIAGVVMTMYDERTNLGQQVARDIRAFFQERVFATVIPRNIRLGEAPSHGMPAVTLRPEIPRRRSVRRARAGVPRARSGAAPPRNGATAMADKRPALGRGLSALIPDAPPHGPPSVARAWTSICCGRTGSSRARQWTTRGSTSSPPRSAERDHPADRRPPRRRQLRDDRRRAPLARRAARRPAQGPGRRPRDLADERAARRSR